MILAYENGSSLLHRQPARLKIPGLLLYSLTAAAAPPPYLPLYALPVLLLLAASPAGRSFFSRQGRFLLSLLILIFLLRALLAGQPAAAALQSARLLLVIAAGHLLAASTSPSALQGALARLLRPLPGDLGGQTALLFRLTLRWIPQLQSRRLRLREAALSRGGRPGGKPWGRPGGSRQIRRQLKTALLPLYLQGLRDSRHTADAMESRGAVLRPVLPEDPISPGQAAAWSTAAVLMAGPLLGNL